MYFTYLRVCSFVAIISLYFTQIPLGLLCFEIHLVGITFQVHV